MSTYLAMEVRLVWMSFVLGCILMASYDLLRWFRFFVPHGLDGDRGLFLLDLRSCHDLSSAVL